MRNVNLNPPTMTERYRVVGADPQQQSAVLVFHTPNKALQGSAAASPPYSRQLTVRRGRKLVQRGPHQGKPLVGAVASIVSLVTILTLLALCRTMQRRFSSTAAISRSLSGTEDDQLRSEILEQCLDLEEEHGVGQAAASYAESRRETRARLVAMLYQSAADFEQMRDSNAQGLQEEAQMLPPRKMPRLNEPLPSTSHPQAPDNALGPGSSRAIMSNAVGGASGADARVTTDSAAAIGDGEQQLPMPKLSNELGLQGDVSASGLRSPAFLELGASARPPTSLSVLGVNRGEDVLSPEAWLDYPSANAYPQVFKQRAVNTASRNPEAEASSSASATAGSVPTYEDPIGSHADADQDTAVTAVLPVQMERAQEEEHLPAALDVTWDGLKGPDASTALRASRSDGWEPCETGSVRLHPFVRLPKVNPKDVYRSFRAQFALSFRYGRASPMRSYMTMRSLFAKASLTGEDVEALMTEAELLASYAANRLSQPQRRGKANYLVTKLSSVFMVLDYLVCTIELLGSKMNTGSWWSQFVQKFHTDYRFPEAGRTRKAEMLNRLVNRLSSALAIYKTGKRPPLEDVVELKRAVLTVAYRGSQLSHPLWELWIQDDREFCRSGEGSTRPSDAQTNGEEEEKGA
ncbi:hypothetical protein EPH_0004190 [Eimeria praecox]|uniref:Transmembrane protein n=1 Tax=Eimeria praecox TaxID=51316 RepID=U6G913_9EIME|nr:hypothetical protein EPH_0004190 [Eimeria praecox]